MCNTIICVCVLSVTVIGKIRPRWCFPYVFFYILFYRIVDAVRNNNPRILKLLLAVPRSIKMADLNMGFLLAVEMGLCECLECLLTSDIDKEVTDSKGNSAIHLSVMTNHPKTLELLVQEKFTLETKVSGNTPLHIAAKIGHDECLDILTRNGANLNARDSAGNTPLIQAVKNSQYICMGNLLRAGCDINTQNHDGRTALHHACHKARGYAQLLAAGADPDVRDNEGNSALMMAASEGFDKVVKALVEANCDVNVTSSLSRRTALHVLSLKGHTDGVTDLVFGGADLNLYDNEMHTPLWYAVSNKRYDIVKILLRANCQVDTFQCHRNIPPDACPTRLALSQGSISIMKDFILTGYDKSHLKASLGQETMTEIVGRHDDIDLWLDHAHDPLHLRQICRLWIRHYLGNVFYHNLDSLPIPDSMKDFLSMKELDTT